MKYLLQFLALSLSLGLSTTVKAIKPIKNYSLRPENWGINYQEHIIKLGDSVKIYSWNLKPVINRKNTTIIISNSDYGNMSLSLMYGAALYDKGYDVVMYDYRGFGASTSTQVLDTTKLFYTDFAQDLKAVYDFYKRTAPNRQYVFMGLSMGTIINTIFFGENQMTNQLFVFDGFINSLSNVIFYLRDYKKTIRYSPISEEVYAQYVDSLPLNKGLIFNGINDRICVLNDSIKNNFEIVNVDGTHLQSFYKLTDSEITGDLYIKDIEDFIKKN